MKAVNIEWDFDDEKDIPILPTEIDIPKGMDDEDEISDYLSEVTGFCHKGFNLLEDIPSKEKILDNALFEQAYILLNGILATPNGSELFYIANILYTLEQSELPLNREEHLIMAQRLWEVGNYSTVPLLTAERVDAVCILLSDGMSSNRSLEFPEATAEQMKKVLLSCDIDVFSEIIDSVAVDNQTFYAPDNEFSPDAALIHQKAVDAILDVNNTISPKPSLTEQIHSASSQIVVSQPTPQTHTKDPTR